MSTPLLGQHTKIAGFMDYVHAAGQGVNTATGGHWLTQPINALKGAAKGVLGQVATDQTTGLTNQGIVFNKDPYNRIQDVNIGSTMSNMAGSALGGAKDWLNKNLGGAGDWIGQHKGALLGGAGALGGMYLLRKLMAKKPKPRPQGYTPNGPMITAPQAFQKAGSVLPSVSLGSLLSPTMAGGLTHKLVDGPDPEQVQSPNSEINIESQQLVKMLASHPEFRHALKQAILKR